MKKLLILLILVVTSSCYDDCEVVPRKKADYREYNLTLNSNKQHILGLARITTTIFNDGGIMRTLIHCYPDSVEFISDYEVIIYKEWQTTVIRTEASIYLIEN